MTNDSTVKDDRFKSILNDPRFIKPKKKDKNRKVSNEKDDRFQNLNRKSSSKKVHIPKIIDYARARVVLESSDEEEDTKTGLDSDSDSISESDSEGQIIQLGPGPSTREINQTEIDLNEDSVDEEPITNQIEATKRIGVVNLDWDNIKPIDIFKVFSSLLSPNHHQQQNLSQSQIDEENSVPNHDDDKCSKTPTETNDIIKGHVLRVRFYKSQFGKERMKVEDIEGPPKEIFKKPPKTLNSINQSDKNEKDDDDDDSEDGEWINNQDHGDEFDEEALRKYQLDRLRYFYAIVELDSVRTARHVFTHIDATEFERTANIFDLSYVPDDMTFDEDDLWDECVEESNDYKGVDFSTDVLRHSKVKLTWDTEDPIRSKYTRLNTQKLKQEELDSMDFTNFLAPPSSEEEIDESEKEEDDHLSIHDQFKGPKLLNTSQSKNIRQLLGLTSDPQSHHQSPPSDDRDSNHQPEELDITFKPGFIDFNLKHNEIQADLKPSETLTKNQKIKQKLKSKQTFDDESILLNEKDQADPQEGISNKKKGKKDKFKHLTPDQQAQNNQSREELKLLMMEEGGKNENQQGKSHFDLNQIIKSEKNKNKKKIKLKKSARRHDDDDDDDQFIDTFSIDPADKRFDRFLVNNPEFAIDPSNPQFKKTRSMMDLLNLTAEKRRRKEPDDRHPDNTDQETIRKPGSELALDHTRVLLNHLKKNPASSKRPKLI